MIRIASLIVPLIVAVLIPSAHCFSVPEMLQFDLTWGGIKAGEATLEVAEQGDYLHITSRATSAKWVSLFYPVEDSIVSTLLKDTTPQDDRFRAAPLRYRVKLREGKHRRDRELLFDHEMKKVTYQNYLDKETLTFDITAATLDVLSAFYYVRSLPLDVGSTIYVEVFDSKKLYQVEVQVLKRERITTSLGTFSTLLIKPILKSEGIFLRKGEVLIWLTDDKHHLPVLLKSKVFVGSVNATLVKSP